MSVPNHQNSGDNTEFTMQDFTADASDARSDEVKKPAGLGVRHLQICFISLGVLVTYMLRVNMSIAVVAMSDSSVANPDFEEFDWDMLTQSVILSSFYWGYIITQIPGGRITYAWSPVKFWALNIFVCGGVNILIPIAASTGGWGAVVACRLAMGLSQGCIFSCLQILLWKWIPANDRDWLGLWIFAGNQWGIMIGLAAAGYLAASSIGWPSIFYVTGSGAILWSILYFFLGSDSPADHRSITSAEKKYIEQSYSKVSHKKLEAIPWKEIFRSVPVWALIIVHCGQNWGHLTLLTHVPIYLKSMMEFDIVKIGTTAALPYLSIWLQSYGTIFMVNSLLRKGLITRATSAKVMNSFGHWGPPVALIGLSYITSSVWAVIVLSYAVSLNAASLRGYRVNHIDLSPHFAGILMALTNLIATFASILAPLLCGLVVTDSTDLTQWRIVLFISAGVYFFGNLIFVIFGKGEVQPWNEPKAEPNAVSQSVA